LRTWSVGKDVTRRPATAIEGTIVDVRILSGIQPTGAKPLGNHDA
jgi:hypothetical protein